MCAYLDEMLASEWHVSKEPTNLPEPIEEDQRYAIHWIPDPGDGLCSPLADDLPKIIADHIVTLHNKFLPYALAHDVQLTEMD